MTRRKSLSVACALALGGAGALVAPVASQAASSASSGRAVLAGSATPSAARAHPVGAVAGSSQVRFDLVLALRDASGAQALLRAVSTPGNASYRHFLKPAQWEARFSPTASEVSQAKSWLRSEGFAVGAVPKDRLVVPATGTASQVESAFQTGLENYRVAGQTLRLATGSLSVPASLAHVVTGAMGVNQSFSRSMATADSAPPASGGTSTASDQYPPPPPAFVPAPPCQSYFGERFTTLNPPYPGYFPTQPDEMCGYKPGQFRSAYGVTPGNYGRGASVGIVDAFGSATIANDASEYFDRNDPNHPFSDAHLTQILNMPFSDESACGDWSTEQAIDIESAHALAPLAHIVYSGAASCLNSDLFAAEQTLVDDDNVNVISNSWGDPAGDLLDDSSYRQSFDNLLMMAGSEGISVLFSSGDWDDNFYLTGVSAPAFPESSPYDTAVGGTTTFIGYNGNILAEYGWDTGRSFLCDTTAVQIGLCSVSQRNTWLPASLDGASGGGTSWNYQEPWYQQPVVPASLADRNAGTTGFPGRVIPDISAEADPSTGFLIGLTETFPDGTTMYNEPRYGGTSLASPIFAGIVADAIGKAGTPMGFLNPTLYGMYRNNPSSIVDIGPPNPKRGIYRRDYVNSVDSSQGYLTSFRQLYYLGPETYCDGTGECYSRQQPLREFKGYDSLTGLGAPSTSFIKALSAF